MIPRIGFWNPNRWPLYSYAPMKWRDWVMLPFAYVLFVVVLGVLHVAGVMEADGNAVMRPHRGGAE